MAPIRAVILALAASSMPYFAAHANDSSAAAANARIAADAADEQLVALRRALWVRLSPAQKSAFAARERAWLNAGRAEEQQRCVSAAPAPTPLVVEQCRLAVAERHRGALAAPIVQASASR
jgi:hypothetical protein